MADARLLAVPDRLDGHRPDQRDLPGALHALPAAPRPARQRPTQRTRHRSAASGASSATARWTSPSRSPRCRSPRASSSTTCTFVINCNLQRLDGPVRGNGRIVEELESLFAGAGWNVIKCLWSSDWDVLFARDHDHALMRAFAHTVDGEFQTLVGQRRRASTARSSSARTPSCRRSSPTCATRTSTACAAAATTRVKIHAAFAAARRARRPADGHPRQDEEGLRHGRRGAGPHDDAPGEEARQRRPARVPRPLRAAAERRRHAVAARSTSRADDSAEMRYLHEPAPGARRLPAGAAQRLRGAAGAAARRDRGVRAAGRRQGDEHDDGVRAHARQPAEGPGARPARRADRRRRGAHVRHGEPVPPGRHLRAGRPALRARGLGLDAVLPRGQERPDPRGRHHRGRRAVVVDRGGDVVLDARPADAAVLHLLLDVRLPARRRPDLGRRRPARARLPDRRDRRPHDARRRRPAAPGRQRATWSPRRCRTAAPTTRRPRASSRSSSTTACARCSSEQQRRLLLRDGDERELSRSRRCRPRRTRACCAACTGFRAVGARRRAPRVQLLGSGAILGEVVKAADAARGRARRRRRRLERHQLQRAGARRRRRRDARGGTARRARSRSYVGEQLAPTRGPIVIATDYVRAVPEQIRAFLPPGGAA